MIVLCGLFLGRVLRASDEEPRNRAIHQYEQTTRELLHFSGSGAVLRGTYSDAPVELLEFSEEAFRPSLTTRQFREGLQVLAGDDQVTGALESEASYPNNRADYIFFDTKSQEEVSRFPSLSFGEQYGRSLVVEDGLAVLWSEYANQEHLWLLLDTGESGSISIAPLGSGYSISTFCGFWRKDFVFIQWDSQSNQRWVVVTDREGTLVRPAVQISNGGSSSIADEDGGRVWISSGNRVEMVDLESGELRSYPLIEVSALGADGDGCWGAFGGSDRLERWEIDDEGGLRVGFRGQLGNSWYSGQILAAEGRACVYYSGRLEIFDPAYARPVLERPSRVVVTEMDREAMVRLRLDRVAEQKVGLRVRTRDGSAEDGKDYLGFDKHVVIPAGSQEIELSIPILEDQLLESNESVIVEFSEGVNLTVPAHVTGSVVIEGSGLQANPIVFFDESGLRLSPWEPWVFDDRMVGFFYEGNNWSNTKIVGLFDRETGQLIKRLDIDSMPTKEGFHLEWKWRRDGGVITTAVRDPMSGLRIVEFDAATGAKLRFRQVDPEFRYSGSEIIGPGSVLTYRFSGTPYLGAEVVSVDPTEDRDIDLMSGLEGSLRHLLVEAAEDRYVVELDIDRGFYSSDEAVLRCFSNEDHSLLWERREGRSAPYYGIGSGGGMLVCWGRSSEQVAGIDLQTGELAWESALPPINSGVATVVTAVGNRHFVTSRSFSGTGAASLVWEVETGVPVEEFKKDSGHPSFPVETDLIGLTESHGTGALLGSRYLPLEAGSSSTSSESQLFELVAERSRPSLEWLGGSLLANRRGSKMVFRSKESFLGDFEFQVDLDLRGASSAPLELDGTKHRIPGDRSFVEVPYKLSPEFDYHPWNSSGFRLILEISGDSGSELSVCRLAGMDGLARFVPHRFQELVADSADLALYGECAIQEDRFVVRNALDDPAPDFELLVISRPDGEIIRRFRNPLSSSQGRFADNFVVHGNHLAATFFNYSTGESEVLVFDLESGAYRGSIADTTGTYHFAEAMAASDDYLVLGTPGVSFGSPATSYVELYRWTDLSRAYRKFKGQNSELGKSLAWNGSDLYAVANSADVTIGGKRYDGHGQIIGYRFPTGNSPQPVYPDPANGGRQSGRLAEGGDYIFSAQSYGSLTAYRRSDMSIAWTMKPPIALYEEGLTAGGGMVNWDDGRELMLWRESSPEILSTTLFATNPQNYAEAFWGQVEDDQLIFTHQGKLRSMHLSDLGDFRGYRSLLEPGAASLPVGGDVDGSGTDDFEEYVFLRIDPLNPPVKVQRIEGFGWMFREGAPPPPDVVVVVELRQADGTWGAVSYREGLGPWLWADRYEEWAGLVSLATSASEARIRYLPHSALGISETIEGWPFKAYDKAKSSDPWMEGTAVDEQGFTMWQRMEMPLWEEGGSLGNLKATGEGGSKALCFKRLRGVRTVEAEVSRDLVDWMPLTDTAGLELEVRPLNDQWEEVHVRRKEADADPVFIRFRGED
ncbi:Calx-beta domain-containing protein [Haloferula chungangensis]|uniref:Calx-beta domain-containing protein n=1 Tax=Haloferula chungangensis TaxID=1048331 RepID=A0ABW2L847_9BACT